MFTFPQFKNLNNLADKMAQLSSTANKAAAQTAPKAAAAGTDSIDSFERVGQALKGYTALAEFVSIGQKVGTQIENSTQTGAGRDASNFGSSVLDTTSKNLKDWAQFRGAKRAIGGLATAGAGLGTGKDILGNDEPAAGLQAGVANGTVDKQGKPSSVPSFGADSRLATEKDECAPSEFWEKSAKGALGGAALGCATSPGCSTSVPFALAGAFTAWLDQTWDCAEQNDEANAAAQKAADEKKSKETTEPEVAGGQTGETGTCEEDVPSASSVADGCENPEDDGNGPQLTSSELQSMGTAAFNSLTQPSDPDADYTSASNASELSPEGMTKKRRDTYSRPSGEDEHPSGGPITGAKIGTTVDGLIQNFENDIAGVNPGNSNEGGNEPR